MISKITTITFPRFSGIRCLMMPYIQGDPDSVPEKYRVGYEAILSSLVFVPGEIGFLTIDESIAKKGRPHRGDRASHSRAIHTEAGRRPGQVYGWGKGGGWGSSHDVLLDEGVEVILANSIDDTCALWNATHEDTTEDGDIGHAADQYPYDNAVFMKAGEAYRIGILTPHESLPLQHDAQRQFLRIVSSGVNGREPYFTENPLVKI